jgi:hypothetical protein
MLHWLRHAQIRSSGIWSLNDIKNQCRQDMDCHHRHAATTRSHPPLTPEEHKKIEQTRGSTQKNLANSMEVQACSEDNGCVTTSPSFTRAVAIRARNNQGTTGARKPWPWNQESTAQSNTQAPVNEQRNQGNE